MNKQKTPVYVCGIELNTTEGPRLHMTIARIAESTEEKLEEIKKELLKMCDQLKPFNVSFGELDKFGEFKNIDVIHCKINDNENLKVLSNFWNKYDIKEYNKVEYHVTTKKQEDALTKQKRFVADNFFIKKIGVKKYLFSTKIKK